MADVFNINDQPEPKEVEVSSDDTMADFLENKLVAGAGVTLTVLNPGGNEQIQITSP